MSINNIDVKDKKPLDSEINIKVINNNNEEKNILLNLEYNKEKIFNSTSIKGSGKIGIESANLTKNKAFSTKNVEKELKTNNYLKTNQKKDENNFDDSKINSRTNILSIKEIENSSNINLQIKAVAKKGKLNNSKNLIANKEEKLSNFEKFNNKNLIAEKNKKLGKTHLKFTKQDSMNTNDEEEILILSNNKFPQDSNKEDVLEAMNNNKQGNIDSNYDGNKNDNKKENIRRKSRKESNQNLVKFDTIEIEKTFDIKNKSIQKKDRSFAKHDRIDNSYFDLKDKKEDDLKSEEFKNITFINQNKSVKKNRLNLNEKDYQSRDKSMKRSHKTTDNYIIKLNYNSKASDPEKDKGKNINII